MNIRNKAIALISALTMLSTAIMPLPAYADTKSDAEASLQFDNGNRLKLRESLDSTGLSASDVMANTYVLEDFNEWSTNRATANGATYDDYTSWVDRAREKIGGSLAETNGVTLPITQLGDNGDFSNTANQFIVNLLKNAATVGWFGTAEDGYYGFKNTGSAKKVIDTTPSIINYTTVNEADKPVYTSTTDSLLYVGDTNGDNKNNVGDWMNFEGTIVLSYDWLVAPVTKVTTELMTLDNIAVHYSRTTADGTARSNKNIGDFPITGLPIVYYDTNTSTVQMRSHEGVEFSKDSPYYSPGEDEYSANRLLPWRLANDAKFFNTTTVEGINLGDWVNLTVVLDVQGTTSSNRVIYQREYLNGELITNEDGESVCTIKPYDTEYKLSTGTSLPAAPESSSLEGYPYDGKWALWSPDEYYGIGVSFANGQSTLGWGGIDNLCYRVYNGTQLEKSAYASSDITNGSLEIGLKTATTLSADQLAAAPKLGVAGIIDLGKNAKISTVKTDIVNDPLVLAGNKTNATVDKSKNLNMSGYSSQGTVTGKKYLDSTAVRISGLDSLSGDEAYVVSINTTDAIGDKFWENVIVTDSSDVKFTGSTFLDFLGNDVTAASAQTASCEYTISRSASEFILHSTDTSNAGVTLEGNNQTYTADFTDGKYTIELSALLEQDVVYTLKKGGTAVASLTPVAGSMACSASVNAGGKPELSYINGSNSNASGYLIGYNDADDVKAQPVTMNAGTFGQIAMTSAYDNAVFVADFKESNGEAELDSSDENIDAFVGAATTVSGNLDEADKDVMLVVLKGDEWSTPAEIADAVVYIDFTTTKETSPTTINGPGEFTEGDYVFDVDLSDSKFTTGKYTFMVYSGDEAYRRVVAYGTEPDNATAITTLNTSAATALGSESTRDALEFYYSYIENLYTDAELGGFYTRVGELMTGELAADALPSDAAAAKAEAISLYRQLAIIAAIEDGKLTSLDNVASDISALTVEPLKTYWKENTGIQSSAIATWKSDVVARLAGSTFSGISSASGISFNKALTEAVILQVVESAEGVDAVINVLQNSFNGLNTITQTTVTNYTAGTVMHQDYASITALQSALNLASQSGTTEGGNNGGIGGNGGGGGTVGNVVIADNDNNASEPVVNPGVGHGFSDMSNTAWASEAVATLKEMGVINGRTLTEFAPNDNVTREEFVKMIVVLAKINVEHGEINFDDVNENDWFYTYVKAAAQKKIVNGVSEVSFGTGQNITRQDMATIINNVLTYYNVTIANKELTFADTESIADYALAGVTKLVSKGIINGYEDNTFRPNSFATRAEAAKMLYGIIGILK